MLCFADAISNIVGFFNWAIPGLFFFIFVLSGLQLTDIYNRKIFLPMSGFEPWISGIRSDRSANCATTLCLFSSKSTFSGRIRDPS